MGAFQHNTVIEVKGRWALEQLGPMELCKLEVELTQALGGPLREALRLALAFLGEESKPDEDGKVEGAWQKLNRVAAALVDGDGEQLKLLVGSIFDRDIAADLASISDALVEMARAISAHDLERIAVKMLVRHPVKKGGLWVAVTPDAPPAKGHAVDSLESLNALVSADHLELWKLILWGLELNLRPLIAALGTARSSERGSTDQGTPSAAPTLMRPGRSSS